MPKEVRHQLTARRVKTEKHPGRYADGQGLYLVVSEHGARWWQWRGTVHGRRREIGMGSAHLVSLAKARETAAEWRALARSGQDPAKVRDAAKRASITFEEAARHVWRDQVEAEAKNPKHIRVWLQSMEAYVFPIIGDRMAADISQADVLAVLRPIWTDKAETARRVRQRMRTVLDWARVSGYCQGINPVEGVERALPMQRDRVRHMPAIPYSDLPREFTRILAVEGMGAKALAFAILTAARSGEARLATWNEVDLDERVWTVPASRMKAGEEHKVPLSTGATQILEDLQRTDELVFPGQKVRKPLSDATLLAVLKRLEIPAVPHGFRSTFRDWCSETTDIPNAVAEKALAHAIPNRVEAAYRRGDLFEKRVGLMQKWCDFAYSKFLN